MLKYEIKLNADNFKRNSLVWGEKYLSPDLSYISGVTSSSNHLEKYKYLAASNSINNMDNTLSIESTNVIRQGYVVAYGKEYDVKSGTYHNYLANEDLEYNYIFVNGKYFYEHKISENASGYTIDNLQHLVISEDEYGYGFVESVADYIVIPSDSIEEDKAKVDAVFWIEDGFVEIDDEIYVFNKDEDGGDGISGGTLTKVADGEPLAASAITNCDGIVCKPYESVKLYEEVTKFRLTKEQSVIKDYSNVSFCSYFYYVKYKDHYCPVKKIYSGDTFSFVCEIPNYVLSATTVMDNLAPTLFDLYFINKDRDDIVYWDYENAEKINNENIELHGVYDFNDLKKVTSFIKVDDSYLFVNYNVMNSNDGREVLIYLDDKFATLNVGDKIVFVNDSTIDGFQSIVYSQEDYLDEQETSSNGGETFIIYNGKKYILEANLLDKVLIETVMAADGNKVVELEYDIEYPNGKSENVDCLVNIDGEKVPFKILNIDGGAYSGGEIQRYGLIVSNGLSGASVGQYNIKPYSGVTIDGKKYIVKEMDYVSISSNQNNNKVAYAYLDNMKNKHTFVINEKMGNSTYICNPYIDMTSFSNNFNRYISREICYDIVSNQSVMTLYIENKIFGERSITKDLVFEVTSTPSSSDDYYDLFNDLTIYLNSGYIHIPLEFDMTVANNIMQDDIVTRDFFEAQKKKAINSIVDMEKDVYLPKYFDGEYKGANTVFKPIKQINLNFHFRTRYLDSWKVKEDYNDYEASASTSGWFITDYYPYKDILSVSGDTLQSTSDLMGLLYFTNDDIFYQKSKVAKSFARLSYYDSTDQQQQSLLATSSVFVDEHKLYKKFIDNSRKNVNDYGFVTEPEFRKNDSGYTITPKVDVTTLNKSNKINVKTEFIDKRGKKSYYDVSIDCKNIVIDENKRLSSRLEINSKYATDTSSEGFYLYIFREYSEKLHPKAIYMRVDFNHAGIGRTIPFIIPMHWSGNTTNSAETAYNELYPEHRLKLTNDRDLEELKLGIPLSSVNSQLYIPLYAVYDFINKEYAYVFNKKYVDIDENGVANIDLFELKVQNEENNEPTEAEIIDISKNLQVKGVININEEQFTLDDFNDKTK